MKSGRPLTHAEARAFYDRFGSKQDWQSFYEDPATGVLLAHADFDHAESVVELGCGTGRLAERILRTRLPATARYLGVDVSSTMIELARARLRPYGERVRLVRTDGTLHVPLPDHSCDRFLSTYVLDLLSEDDIRVALREARRVLAPGGRLCLVSLTYGESVVSRLLCSAWTGVHAVRPQWVGGCRPLRLADYVSGDLWRILHRQIVCTAGICSEVLVAS